jgi:hypothetical protein
MSPTRMTVPLPLTTASHQYPRPSHAVQRPNTEDQTIVNLDEMSLDEVSREAVEKWKSLKRELGFECQVIDRALLARRPTPSPSPAHGNVDLTNSPYCPTNGTTHADLTPRLAREWADNVKAAADAEDEQDNPMDESNAPRPPAKKQRSPRWQFYNVYNSVFYPTTEKEDSPKRHWNVTLTVLASGRLSS